MKNLWKRYFLVAAAVVTLSGPTAAQQQPGNGEAVTIGRTTYLNATGVTAEIAALGLTKLGYKPSIRTLDTAALLLAVQRGDIDLAVGINWPQLEPSVRAVEDKVVLVGQGGIEGGGLNGYMIDKATSEKYNITNIEQLKDPELAKLFDADGDGKANLVNCNPGSGCADTVDFQVQAFGLSDTVKPVGGNYQILMADMIARVRRGEGSLYYTWAPSWMVHELVPGKDVVWLQIPFDALPPGMEGTAKTNSAVVKGVVGCAGGADPCHMTQGPWNYRIVVNKDFLSKNPAIGKLMEQVKWSNAKWSGWEAAISGGAASDEDLKRAAQEWVDGNPQEFQDWMAAAGSAASK